MCCACQAGEQVEEEASSTEDEEVEVPSEPLTFDEALEEQEEDDEISEAFEPMVSEEEEQVFEGEEEDEEIFEPVASSPVPVYTPTPDFNQPTTASAEPVEEESDDDGVTEITGLADIVEHENSSMTAEEKCQVAQEFYWAVLQILDRDNDG